MQAITIASGKGGVGKTVIAASLARILSETRSSSVPDLSIRVLVLDLDLHTRGLTYLMYPNFATLRALPISMEEILLEEDIQLREMNFNNFERFIEHSSPVVVPASLQTGMPFLPRFAREPSDVLIAEGLRTILGLAESSGVDFVIIDTRAGPDVLSISASLLADVTWLVLEEDRISWRTSLNFLLQTESFRDRVRKDPPWEGLFGSDKASFLFLSNKVTRRFIPEVRDVLLAYDFLPAIPLDTSFLERYMMDPFEAVAIGALARTQFGKSVDEALDYWMQSTELKHDYGQLGWPVPPLSLLEILGRFYGKPERLLPMLALSALAIKWAVTLFQYRSFFALEVSSFVSDTLLLAILLLLARGRLRR